jgi:hypothetical protein
MLMENLNNWYVTGKKIFNHTQPFFLEIMDSDISLHENTLIDLNTLHTIKYSVCAKNH